MICFQHGVENMVLPCTSELCNVIIYHNQVEMVNAQSKLKITRFTKLGYPHRAVDNIHSVTLYSV